MYYSVTVSIRVNFLNVCQRNPKIWHRCHVIIFRTLFIDMFTMYILSFLNVSVIVYHFQPSNERRWKHLAAFNYTTF